jgi:hypothetical protein
MNSAPTGSDGRSRPTPAAGPTALPASGTTPVPKGSANAPAQQLPSAMGAPASSNRGRQWRADGGRHPRCERIDGWLDGTSALGRRRWPVKGRVSGISASWPDRVSVQADPAYGIDGRAAGPPGRPARSDALPMAMRPTPSEVSGCWLQRAGAPPRAVSPGTSRLPPPKGAGRPGTSAPWGGARNPHHGRRHPGLVPVALPAVAVGSAPDSSMKGTG